MAFTFYILPGRADEVAVAELAESASRLLRGYVAALPVEDLVEVSEPLAREAREALRGCEVRVALGAVGARVDRFGGEGSPCLAFGVEPGGGGGFVRRLGLADPEVRAAAEAARSAAQDKGLLAEVERRLAGGACLAVERLLGQPPLATLAHGFLAAALAEACDGLVVSVDGAWDAELWPCGGPALAASFMSPGPCLSEGCRRRAEAMLREVVPALAPFDEAFACRLLEELIARLVSEVNAVRGDEQAELAAFDRGLDRLDTARLLCGAPLRERELLLGPAGAPEPKGCPRSAFARLHPAPDEYQRWLEHLGEHLA